jgi:ferredoxin
MKCFICDATLSDNEVQYNNYHEDWDPCGTCLAVIDEVFEPLDEEDIQRQIEFEWHDETHSDDVPMEESEDNDKE